MLKIIYMLGIPGSGKSYIAEKIAKQERAEIISTDRRLCCAFGRRILL